MDIKFFRIKPNDINQSPVSRYMWNNKEPLFKNIYTCIDSKHMSKFEDLHFNFSTSQFE